MWKNDKKHAFKRVFYLPADSDLELLRHIGLKLWRKGGLACR